MLLETIMGPLHGTPGAGARALMAAGTACALCLLLGRPSLRWLRRLNVGERTEKTPIEDAALRSAIAGKSGTPTMGGLFLLAAMLVACLLWTDPTHPAVAGALLMAVALAVVGAVDDLLKLRGRGHTDRGLKLRHKLAIQCPLGALFALLALRNLPTPTTDVLEALVPLVWAAPLLAVLGALVVALMSNSTNVTDGMDGLLAGLCLPATLVLGLACLRTGGAGAEMAVVCGALGGACAGFLVYNRHPARVFMGDTGSLPIGGVLACVALATGRELVLGLVCLVFLAEGGSSVLQIGWFKLLGRRVLPIAPVHHIFQRRGHAEPRVVRGFYLAGVLAALAALTLLWM